MLYKKLARYLFTLGCLIGLLFLTILLAFLAHSQNYFMGEKIFLFMIASGLFLCAIFGTIYLRLMYILKTQVATPLHKALQVLKDNGIPLSSLDNEAEILYGAVLKAGKILNIDRIRQTIYPFWNRVFDENEILNGTLRLFGEAGHILSGAFYRYDSFKDELILQASYAFPEKGQRVLAYGVGFVGEAAAQNKTVVVKDPQFTIPVGISSIKPSMLYCIPVATQKLYGVLVVAMPSQTGEDQLSSMEILAAQLGIVLDRVHQMQDLKKMMEELNERTNSLNRELTHMNYILNNSADGIIIINSQGQITSFSRGAEDITGYRASEVIGKECCQVMKHHSQEFEQLCGSFLCAFCNTASDTASEKKPVVGREVYIVHKNGNYVPVLLTSTPIYDDDGNLIEVLQIFKDLTEIKNNLTKLEEANRSKSEFLATMSHELRTPLNAVLGFAELLETENFGPLNEKQKRFISNIHMAGKHLLSLINDILDISRVESGKMEWERELIDLPELFKGAINLLREKAAQNGITIQLNLEPDVGEFIGDERKIKQIAYNLLANAVKFTPEGGEVGMDVRKRGHWLEVEVWDTGIGIPPEKRDAIFEPFYQVDNSLTRKHQGSGLGLALVKKMVNLAGGQVWVDEAPGKSTVFKFTIPEHDLALEEIAPTQEEAAQPETGAKTEKLCILIEDDAKTAELLETYLSELGLKVKTAANGEEGLGLIARYKPELVVLDILLPGISGWEVLTQLKSSIDLCSIPVLVISILEERKKGLALGARDYLVKPVDKELLKSCVERILQRRGRSYKALVIDDDLRSAQHMEKYLEAINFKVVTALDGREGLTKAQDIKPDIILLDLMMPEMDGFEFLKYKEENKEIARIPVVVVTSKTITPVEKRFLEERTLYIARKSDFGKEDFLDKVLELLEEGEVRCQKH